MKRLSGSNTARRRRQRHAIWSAAGMPGDGCFLCDRPAQLRAHRARQERQRDRDVKLEVEDLEEQYRSGDYTDACYYDPSDPDSYESRC